MTINMRTSLLLNLVLVAALMTGVAQATTVVIINGDGPNEGFNDPAPFTPVGGNNATTLGQARLNAFQFAADLWAACIQSNVVIQVEAQMDPLFCNLTGAILGGAGAQTAHGNFTGAPVLNTWYPQALANSLFGSDLNPAPDIFAQFNSNLNGSPSCLGGTGWYYGFDQNPGGDIDFVTVVAHEIGHGLGFQTFVDLATGAKLQGFNDTYMLNLEHHGASPNLYPNMSNVGRVLASTSDPNLHWVGSFAVARALLEWTGGLSNGHPRIHGPNPQQAGSSVSHWSPAAVPNQMMEPSYVGPNHDLGVGVELMRDVGWVLIPKCPTPPSVQNTDSLTVTFPPGTWTVRVEMTGLGPGNAVNVNAEMCDTLPWLTITDPNCSYGTIAQGGASFGAPDDYTLDISAWPGGAFDVQLKVTWEDDCGNQLADTLNQTLLPPTVVGVPDAGDKYHLAQNFPNPFNPTTEIFYTIPRDEQVALVVYDVSGRLVRTLVSDRQSSGPHVARWDGKDNEGRDVSSGVYFYRLEAGSFLQTRRMVLLK